MPLKDKRKAAGITQAKAAELLGIGLRHYQKLEAGQSPLTPSLEKLAGFVLKGTGNESR